MPLMQVEVEWVEGTLHFRKKGFRCPKFWRNSSGRYFDLSSRFPITL